MANARIAGPCEPFLAPAFAGLAGAPVRPAYRAIALRSRKSRDKISWTKMSAVSTPIPMTRARETNHRMPPLLRRRYRGKGGMPSSWNLCAPWRALCCLRTRAPN